MNTQPKPPTRLTVSGGPKVEPRIVTTLNPETVRLVIRQAHRYEPVPVYRTRLFLVMGVLIVVGLAVGLAYAVGQVLS